MNDYYKIQPDLSDNRVAYIDDWEFTYWPDKPKSDIIQNADGTFSVIMEENFVPLVTQLQNLFENERCPEEGTYLGEAILKGKGKPKDLIYGDFIKNKRGLVVSSGLLNVLKKFNLPEHKIYELPLIKRRKKFNGYSYIYFIGTDDFSNLDLYLINGENSILICVSQRLMGDICNSNIDGCEFTPIKEVDR